MGRPYGTAKLIYIANDGFRSLRLESKVSTTPREDKTDDTISGAHAPCNHWSRCPGPVCHYDGGPSSEIGSPDLGGLTRLDACINFGSHLCSGGRDGPGARRNHAPHHKTIPGAEPPRPPNALVFELFRTFVGNIGGTVPIILRSFAARAGLLGSFMSAVSVPAYSKLPARSEFLVSVSTPAVRSLSSRNPRPCPSLLAHVFLFLGLHDSVSTATGRRNHNENTTPRCRRQLRIIKMGKYVFAVVFVGLSEDNLLRLHS